MLHRNATLDRDSHLIAAWDLPIFLPLVLLWQVRIQGEWMRQICLVKSKHASRCDIERPCTTNESL